MRTLALLFTLLFTTMSFAANQLDISTQGKQLRAASTYSYTFNNVRPNQIDYLHLTLTNSAEAETVISSMYIYGAYFSASSDCPETLAAGEKCNITIRYWPPFTGFHTGKMEIKFADGEQININLNGWCQEF